MWAVPGPRSTPPVHVVLIIPPAGKPQPKASTRYVSYRNGRVFPSNIVTIFFKKQPVQHIDAPRW